MIASRRLLATVLVGLLSGSVVPAQEAPLTASLSGAVFFEQGRTPLAGATVHAADPKSGLVYSSGPTDENGAFEIVGLPAARLELGVAVGEGLYLVGTPVSLAPTQNRELHIALAANAQVAGKAHSTGYVAGRPSVWTNPLTAALIVVGAALVIGALVNEATSDDDRASPS